MGMYAATVLLPALVLTLGTIASTTVAQTTSGTELHGSGSSVAPVWTWKTMDLFMSRSNTATDLSYRSIGTIGGQTEFLGSAANNYSTPFGDFHVGDTPLSAETYTTLTDSRIGVLQVPLLIAPVSFFHSIPGVGTGSKGLVLSACTLAKIYLGTITTWDDPEILEQNPGMAALIVNGTRIMAMRRNKASGSTVALTNYFGADGGCPTLWNLTGSNTSAWNQTASTAVDTSDLLLSSLQNTMYALGYLDSGTGRMAGLNEVGIVNRFNVTLTSNQADRSALSTALATLPAITTDISSFVPLPTPSPNSWPMDVVLYMYLRQNSTFLGKSGSLLSAYLQFLLASDAQALLSEYQLSPLDPALRANLTTQVTAALTIDPTAPTWSFDNGNASAAASSASAAYTISSTRNTYRTSQLFATEADIDNQIMPALKLGNVYQVHGSGSWYASPYLRTVEHYLEQWSRLPVTMTYRTVGSYEAQQEFSSPEEMFSQMNHFKVGDLPLSSADYTRLSATPYVQGVVQIPFMVGGMSIFYNAPAFQYNIDGSSRVKLTACDVASIFSGAITNWSSIPSLTGSSYSYPITVFAYAGASSNTLTLTRYLSMCGASWTLGASELPAWPIHVNTSFRGVPIMNPWEMAAAIATTPYSIGYLESAVRYMEQQFAFMPHLYEANLQLASGAYAISTGVDLTAAAAQILASPSVPRTADGSPNITGDWSGVDPSVGVGAWPMAFISYIYCYQNLSLYGESGPLLKAMLNYTLNDDGQVYMLRYGGNPLPSSARMAMQPQLRFISVAPNLADWKYEDRLTLGPGVGLTTFSRNRGDYTTMQLFLNEMQMNNLQGRLSAALPKMVRVVGTNEMGNLTGRMLADITGMAASPVRLTYEVAPSSQSALDTFVGRSNGYAGYHDMLILDSPLPTAAWTELNNAGVRVVQVPIFLQAVALYYNGSGASLLQTDESQSNLNFSACVLAGIWNGSISSWSDPSIALDNPNFKAMAATPIQFGYATSETAKLAALKQYISSACNLTAALPDLPVNAAPPFETQDALAGFLQINPFGVLGIMGRMYGKPYNLTLAQVQSQYMYPPETAGMSKATAGMFLKPGTAPPGITQSTYLLQPLLDTALPALSTADHGSFSLVWADKSGLKGHYPIMTASFAILRADCTFMNESGGLLKGLLAYMVDPWQVKLADMAAQGHLAGGSGMATPTPRPGVGTLVAGANQTTTLRAALAAGALPQLQTRQDVQQWPLVTSRAQVNGSPNAIILTLWQALDYQDGALMAADTTTRLLANQLNMLQAARMQQMAHDALLQKVQSIAVAGVVLAVILSVIALAIGGAYLKKTKILETKYQNLNLASGFGGNKNWSADPN